MHLENHDSDGVTNEPGRSFSALVAYEQPGIKELKRRFPNNADFGKFACAVKRPSDVPTNETREVVFEIVCLGRAASTNEVSSEMIRRGLRAALYEELLGFGQEYPNEWVSEYPLMAIGSVARVGGRPANAGLWDGPNGPGLYLFMFYPLEKEGHESTNRFLAVRK